ncbi:putative odorant receptor 71a [Belonocnema kinseyi]|uniref:putative odorant receptor 71a n=1 Tax=Belonocnema kinseyi TaxID=2817044 RepID=UPI00143CF578|nr:putative odorant receptor 71a [Belonocnema kinseyi]
MDIFDSSYFRLNKVLMNCIGQWPYQSRHRRIIISAFITTMNSFFLFTLICGIVTSNNVDDSINILTATVMAITCSSKLLNSIIHSKKLKNLLDEIKLNWTLGSKQEVNILKNFTIKGRKLTFIYVVYMYFTLALYLLTGYTPQLLNIIKPLNETRLRKRPYKSNYFVDEDKYYYHITLHEQITILLNVTTLVTTDTIYVVYTEHVCGMFAILRYRLENILKDKNSNSEMSVRRSLQDDESLTKEILGCISLHRRNIEFTKKLDAAFSASLFVQVGLSMILLSITGYVTILKLGVLDEFLQFCPYVVMQIVFIFYLCLPGQKIIDASENIVNSLYNSQWYRMPFKTQKLFILLMVRSSRPCCFQAGGVFVLSLQTFSLCIQRAFSFFTVLLKMKE